MTTRVSRQAMSRVVISFFPTHTFEGLTILFHIHESTGISVPFNPLVCHRILYLRALGDLTNLPSAWISVFSHVVRVSFVLHENSHVCSSDLSIGCFICQDYRGCQSCKFSRCAIRSSFTPFASTTY